MSDKGRDSQKGFYFQNKTALLYMLYNYKYNNFISIKLEGSKLEDFTLFFKHNNSSSFIEFEVKNWAKPLNITDVKNIIKKEAAKGLNRYSDQDRFCIIAPAFTEECKEIINFAKSKFYFYTDKDKNFNSIKTMYKEMYKGSPALQVFKWSKEEILFIKHVDLIELKELQLDNYIRAWFHYERSFFYTESNLKNIINRLFKVITKQCSQGGALTKLEITNILDSFCKEEANKSPYDLNQDLGQVICNIEKQIQTEKDFKELNNAQNVTAISARKRAVFSIIDTLKQKQFKFKSVKWFFDKILIKDIYLFHSMGLIKEYLKKDLLDEDDKNDIVDFILKIHKYQSNSSPVFKFYFDSFYFVDLIKVLTKLSDTKLLDNTNKKLLNFLDNYIPHWQTDEHDFKDDFKYRGIPKLIDSVIGGSTQKGIDLIFEKYNFTIKRTDNSGCQTSIFEFIREFINKDFKKNFNIIVKKISNQFKILYKSRYNIPYEGYELSGGWSSFKGQYEIDIHPWEKYILYNCIQQYYQKTKDWEFLKSLIDLPASADYPVFVKRSFMPFLLEQLNNTSIKNPEDNNFYKALEKILDIKKGFPRTEEIIVYRLYKSGGFQIPDAYLNAMIKKIIYKYSSVGIIYDPGLLQLLIKYTADGKLQFKEDLKRTFLDKNFQNCYDYDIALRILDRYIKEHNNNIKNFFNEIKSHIDVSQNINLLYFSAASNWQPPEIQKLLKSSSKKELDKLAGIIQNALLKNNTSFINHIIEYIKNNLNDLYKRAAASDNLKTVIAQLPLYIAKHNNTLAENIIKLCIEDTNLCGESKELQKQIIKREDAITIQTMRAYLCDTLDSYIRGYSDKSMFSSQKLEQAFLWVKTLIDLDGSLADSIPNFPKPNYYLRYFASIPLESLSYYLVQKNLNKYKNGLGAEIKKYIFTFLEHTQKEIKDYNYKPIALLNHIAGCFDVIRNLNEQEAKKVLKFIKECNVYKFSHLFIYYALFREKHFLNQKKFNSSDFKQLLTDICSGRAEGPLNKIRNDISFTFYKSIENNNKDGPSQPDFTYFETIKNYWVCLFDTINKDVEFSLLMALSFVLNHSQLYYNKYKEYLFQLIQNIVKKPNEDYFIHLNEVLPAVSKYHPDDLICILFIFLKEGDNRQGDIPFRYEVERHVIPEIKKQKNKISIGEMKKAKTELMKYDLML